MTQTRKGSLAEALTNVVTGFPINYAMNLLILPLTWDADKPYSSALWTGVAFTIVSLVRQLVVRRIFNNIKARWNNADER